MPTYQLQPVRAGRHWWAVVGATAAILLLPVLLNLTVPTPEREAEDVRLGAPGYDWEIPLPAPGGADGTLACDSYTEALFGHGWDCGNVVIQSTIAQGGTDPERTLRRMMRAQALLDPPADADVFREGDARMIIDDDFGVVGISFEGTGEQRDLTMVAVLTGQGARLASIADSVWRAYTDRELPAVVVDEIHDLWNPPVGNRTRNQEIST